MYCGVIITTNHLANGIYIPEDDRRYDVIDCATMQDMGLSNEDKRRDYFTELWDWFYDDGASHIAAYLHEHDISKFNASNGQRKTDAHKTVVAGGMHGDQWLDDILDDMSYPKAVRSDWIITKAIANGEKEGDVKRKLVNSMGRSGYAMHRSDRKDGRWKINSKIATVYTKVGTDKSYDPTEELSNEPF